MVSGIIFLRQEKIMILDFNAFKPNHTASSEQHKEYVNSLQENTRVEHSVFEQDQASKTHHAAVKAHRAAMRSLASLLEVIAKGG